MCDETTTRRAVLKAIGLGATGLGLQTAAAAKVFMVWDFFSRNH